MLSININKLQGEVEEREKRKIKIFEKILDMCYQRILTNNEKSDNFSCTYIVPNVVFGLPLYDVSECTKFIMDKLISKGFEIVYAYPTTIHISWIPEERKITNYNNYNSYNNYNNFANQYKSLEAPQQTQNTKKIKEVKHIPPNHKIIDNSRIMEKHHGQQIQYKSIDEYLQSKPLIYDPDDINIFQNKLDNIFI